MARFFIDRPVFAIVLSIFITLAGLISIFNLPIAQYPQISPPRVTVSTNYVGASAETVEQSVAQAIEQQVNGVEGMIDMRSTSDNSGGYKLSAIFEIGRDGDMASVQVQNRVAQANSQLPSEVITSGINTKKEAADTVMFFAIYSPEGSYNSLFLKNYASINLIEDLKRIKGIGSISEYGPEYSMRIWLHPDKMAQLGVTATDISTAIKSQNTQTPAGSIGKLPSIKEQQFEYSAQVRGRLVNEAEFKNIIVKANSDGSFLKLGDIADVRLDAKDLSTVGNINGSEAVIFAIQLTPEANAMETVAEVQRVMKETEQRFPPDLKLITVMDNTQFIRESMVEVIKTFMEALLLVLIIVFIFLQSWQATMIPMLAVPVSLIGTFASFIFLGFSINTLTLFAMVLAIGLVVDDAIVVVEAVEHHIKVTKLSPKEATYRAMEEVSGPVVAIAFVLASVFIPVAFFGGTAGVLYKQFAITISVSMALSALVALTLTPALCAMLLKPHAETAHKGMVARFFDKFNAWFERLTGRYTKGVTSSIRLWKTSLACLLIVCVLAIAIMRVLPSGFVPDEDQGYFLASISLPEAASNVRTQAVGQEIIKKVRSIPGVSNVILVSGLDILVMAPKSSGALLVVGLDPWSDRKTVQTQVQSVIGQVYGIGMSMPEVTLLPFNAAALPGASSTGSLSMAIQDRSGGSIQEMSEQSNKFIAAARKRPELGSIYSTFRADTPSYRFEVDREKAEKLGVPVNQVFSALQTFLGGLQVNDFNRFGRTWKVIMQAEPEFRADVDSLRFFFVRSNNGTMVPLNTLVTPVTSSGPSTVTRFNATRSFNIGGSPAPGYSTGQAMAALEEVAAQTLPGTYSYDWVDQSRDEKQSSGRSTMIFGFAILFAFLCLAALYESWSIPFAVLLSVPTAVLGAVLFQYARGLQNNVYMQIGLVMLIGLAAKNAILIVEFAKQGVDQGKDIVEAAIEGAKLRLRPILMTSFAFILGCVPLAMASGAGAGARNAMGTAVVGGMIMATILGIFIIPVLFVTVERLIHKFSRKKKVL